MTTHCRYILLLLIASLLFTMPASAGVRTIPSADHIPLGDWTYDAMTSLAAHGLVPGFSARVFLGDRLFDRMEMAEIVAAVVSNADANAPVNSRASLITQLVREFTPDLHAMGSNSAEEWLASDQSKPSLLVTGYAKALAQDNNADTRLMIPHRISLYNPLSDRSFGMVTFADKGEQFFQQLRNSTVPDKLIIQGYSDDMVWSVGRQYLNWGPAYAGSLILSDNSIGFWQARAAKEIDLGKWFGRFKVTEFASMFDDDKQLYFFGRRYEKPLAKRWHWGISETVLMNKAPNPAILVLPFYGYQAIFGGTGSVTDRSMNTVYATDLQYKAAGGQSYYGELLIDDITAPDFLGAGFSRPRKTGYTLGLSLPRLTNSKLRSSLRAEYTHIDRRTYEATRPEFPELAYAHNNRIIGHPIGPNAEMIYLRGESYLNDKWSLTGELMDVRQAQAGLPTRTKSDTVSLTVAYDIAAYKSVALRISPFKTTPPGQPSDSGTSYDLSATFAY